MKGNDRDKLFADFIERYDIRMMNTFFQKVSELGEP